MSDLTLNINIEWWLVLAVLVLAAVAYSDSIKKGVRSARLHLQRFTRGYDDYEVWGFNDALVKWALPRLKAFSKAQHSGKSKSVPEGMTDEEWTKIIDAIVLGFEGYMGEWSYDPYETNKACELFSEHWTDIWD
jgi:hypothetical protein